MVGAIELNLSDLKERFYDIVGDDKDAPRWFPWARVLELMNEGALVFRRNVEEIWARLQVKMVAGQAVYTVPSDSVRIRRIAFDDQTLEPKTILGLAALDPEWDVRTGAEPEHWTSDGLAHNQFRLYPEPTVNSKIDIAYTTSPENSNSDYGILVKVAGSDTHTFTTDFGLLLKATDGVVTTDFGEFTKATAIGASDMSLWYVPRPATMTEGADVPLRDQYQIAVLWYALWKTYEEESDHHNSVLAGLYRKFYLQAVGRGRMRAENPLPRMVHVRRGQAGFAQGDRISKPHPTLEGSVDLIDSFGVPTGETVNIRFPRRVRFQ